MATDDGLHLKVDNSHLLNNDLEYYDYADSLAERQRLAHEIADEMQVEEDRRHTAA